ncbi:27370_t:CDS:1, partial [Dentiscutata erythropus]
MTMKETLKYVHKKMNRLKRSNFASLQYLMIKYCPYRNLFRPIMPTIGHGVSTNVP